MADETHVKGLSDLQKFLEELPVKMEKNIMRGALRAGMNVIRPVAQANINSKSGELAKGLKVRTNSRYQTVMSKLRATGKHSFVAPWLEFGVAAHDVSPRTPGGFLSFLGVFTKKVHHPGFSKKPFLRPALDSMKGAAVVATAEYIKARLMTKEGIDTSGVKVEGDGP